ncbi:unnamed protein product, partial [Darwinula stevensoni]
KNLSEVGHTGKHDLLDRIRSFERFLEKHPEYLGKVALLQVAVPSRTDVKEYQQLKEQMDLEIGRINGRFSTLNWSPIRYIYGCISQDELAAYYRDSSVALVTPLRDGMNLVAKEYVACQVDKPGVLILSPFAGAGETMHEALLVNPYELDDVADTLHRALTMPIDEREMRMYHLKKREQTMNVDFWLTSFLKAVGGLVLGEEQLEPMAVRALGPMTMDDFDEVLSDYIGDSAKVALLLDYDGTLAPDAPKLDMAFLPTETKNILARLSKSSDVAIAIISGRNLENIQKLVGISDITYAGSHGLEILHPDGSKFVQPIPEEYFVKMRRMCQELQDECCKEGAWIENKGSILTYHFRAVPIQLRSAFKQRAAAIITKNDYRAYLANCAIEARPPVQWDKGRASIYILRTMFGVDWLERIRVIYVGDDVTDEDAMRTLQGVAYTFRITSHNLVRTAASKCLSSTDSVLTLLKWVERHVMKRHMPDESYYSPRPHSANGIHSDSENDADVIKSNQKKRQHADSIGRVTPVGSHRNGMRIEVSLDESSLDGSEFRSLRKKSHCLGPTNPQGDRLSPF